MAIFQYVHEKKLHYWSCEFEPGDLIFVAVVMKMVHAQQFHHHHHVDISLTAGDW